MNLSQILNPPSSAAPLPSTTTIAARPQDRVSSLPPHSVAASTAVLRLDSLSGTSPGARALKKQTTSVSKREGLPSAPSADFQEDTAAHSKLNSGKIKPNQVNNGYSTHTFRANMLPTKDAKDKDKVNGTTSTTILMSGAGTTPVSSGVGSFLTVAGGTSLQLVTKQHTSSSSTVRKRQRNQEDMSPSHESASSLIQTQADSQEEQKRKLQKMQAQQEPKISDASAKKKSSQKTKLSSSTQTETDSQQPREIRFVMTEHTLKTSMDTSTTSSVTATATAPSSSRNTPTPKDSTEGILDQADPPQSPPTPDFEKNADGKYRCSWPRCGKEFTVVSRLTTHYRIHTGKPPYLCGYKDCQKAFHTVCYNVPIHKGKRLLRIVADN
ncbi:hypothetical protein B0O80DRAFT_129813 [Mortierella sp. GBAus27b]|nr:hypothetical protein B0O80DRAFT_129813 [Mortierella sp. GBAus27b]